MYMLHALAVYGCIKVPIILHTHIHVHVCLVTMKLGFSQLDIQSSLPGCTFMILEIYFIIFCTPVIG